MMEEMDRWNDRLQVNEWVVKGRAIDEQVNGSRMNGLVNRYPNWWVGESMDG